MIKVGIIGTGYWGKHHLRIFSKIPCNLVGICDLDSSKETLAREYGVKFFTDYRKLLRNVDAVSIVTPPSSHFELAKKALRKGKHVLLEKPFVFKYKEAEILNDIAKEKKSILMAGHTYLYHPAIIRMKDLIKSGNLGNVYYLLMQWLNLGIIRKDVNALWNFGPHPISVLLYLFDSLPVSLTCNGKAYIQTGIEDVVFLTLRYNNGMMVQINFSWLHPVKIREIAVVGSKKLLYFNDANSATPLTINDKGIAPEEYRRALNWENYSEFQSKVRYGSTEIPNLPAVEPLQSELEDFIRSIEEKKDPVADISSSISVVKIMEIAQKSLQKRGKEIEIG